MTIDPGPSTAVSAHARGSTLAVTVIPRASTTAFQMSEDGTLRVRVAAPPVDGAANKALLRFLADALYVPRSRMAIVSGESSRRKRILVEGISPEALGNRLQEALDQRR